MAVKRSAGTLTITSDDVCAVSKVAEAIAEASARQTFGVNQADGEVTASDKGACRKAVPVEESNAASRLSSALASELVHRAAMPGYTT